MWEQSKKALKIFNNIPLRKLFAFLLFLLLYFFLPAYLSFKTNPRPFLLLSTFYLLNLAIVSVVFSKNRRKSNKSRRRIDLLQEQINLAAHQNSVDLKNQQGFKERLSRYSSLRKIIEEINASLTVEDIAEQISSLAFSLIADNKGTCVFYLVNSPNNTLSLIKTKKEDKRLIVKSKEGDIFDNWVLRHSSPLIIEDIRKDFRFDLEKLKSEEERKVSCLISAPLVSGNKFLGILRLEHPQPHFYSQDDLRFLMTISDIGAVALENGQLYQNMQELAIHDGLTLLFTKGHFMELLKLECKRSIRHKEPFSLLLIDIDFFKKYNDKFGHVAGDLVLKSLGNHFIDFLKENQAVISRFGGEEFCVILPQTSKKEAFEMAQSLRSSIEGLKLLLRRQQTPVTVSIGVSTFLDDTSDETELIMKADKAMYAAKKSGRNAVACA